MMLDVLTFVVLIVLVVCVAFAAVKIAALPGRMAADRGHPQADAIRVCGWLGLLTLGLMWPFALIWAYMRPAGANAELARRLESLEQRMEAAAAAQDRMETSP